MNNETIDKQSINKPTDKPFSRDSLFKKIYNNQIVQLSIMSAIAAAFLCTCFLYAFKNSIAFPIINTCLLLSTFFIFNGRYRMYSLFFAIPFVIFFNYKPLGIGSFFSYSIIFYSIIVIVELFFRKERDLGQKIDRNRLIAVLFLTFYSIIFTTFNSGFYGVFKTISIFAYIACVSLFFFDRKGKKNLTALILTIGISLLIANCLAYLILFILKGNTAIQFLERFTSRDYAIHYQANNASFRFPGLTNDPNYLGFYTLLLTSVVIMSFKRLKLKVLIVIVMVLLQAFPIIGESKNYFFTALISILAFIIYMMFKKKNGVFIGAGILLVCLGVLIIFGNSLLLPILLRIINVDSRDGFLNSFTTGRTTIQLMYFNEYITNPSSFLIGKGFNSLLNNASAHSVFVMSFWYFGIIGTFLYYYWILTFFKISKLKEKKLFIAPLFIMFICAMSLDYISYSEMFLFILYLCALSINNYEGKNAINEGNRKYEISI